MDRGIKIYKNIKHDDGKGRKFYVSPGIEFRGNITLEGFPKIDKILCNLYHERDQSNSNDCEGIDYKKVIDVYLTVWDKPFDFINQPLGYYKEILESKIYLYGFYNLLTMNSDIMKKYAPDEYPTAMAMIKGGAHIILCSLLSDAYQRGLIQLDDKITLQASGSINEDYSQIKKLIEYYQHLGFEILFPDHFKDEMAKQQPSIPMVSTVKKIFQMCKEVKINENLTKILDTFKF